MALTFVTARQYLWLQRTGGYTLSIRARASSSAATGQPQFQHRNKLQSQFIIYYNDVYEVNLPPNHRFPMKKYMQVRLKVQDVIQKRLGTQGVDDSSPNLHNCEFQVSPIATVDELVTTHCPKYVDRFLSGDQTKLEQRNVGFPWSPQGVDRALSSVGGTIAATMKVCAGIRLGTAEMTWAAHIAGGTHHAFHDYGEGFCVFSDIAVAANVALQRFPDVVKRILIIDLDVHQGNGNAKLFAGREEVVTFSMHCGENYFSPKESSDLDIELPAGCTDETYLSTLQHWLKRIFSENGKYDLIFFQAGIDILSDDRLGRMNLSRRGIQRRNMMVFEYAERHSTPVVITMGGGYPRKDWDPIIEAHADVYLGAQRFLAQGIAYDS